ncbi:Hypothetical predicted protein, partial [Olea europaea subsp. europaea]
MGHYFPIHNPLARTETHFAPPVLSFPALTDHDITRRSGATRGLKIDVVKANKKAGVGARKALNDISNLRNSTMLQMKKDLT